MFDPRLDMFEYGSSIVLISIGVTTMGVGALFLLRDAYNMWTQRTAAHSTISNSDSR